MYLKKLLHLIITSTCHAFRKSYAREKNILKLKKNIKFSSIELPNGMMGCHQRGHIEGNQPCSKIHTCIPTKR